MISVLSPLLAFVFFALWQSNGPDDVAHKAAFFVVGCAFGAAFVFPVVAGTYEWTKGRLLHWRRATCRKVG